MNNENLILQITSKGEYEGLQIMMPLLQFLSMQKREGNTIDDAINQLVNSLNRAFRRSKENDDGLLTPEEYLTVVQFEKIYQNLLKNLNEK